MPTQRQPLKTGFWQLFDRTSCTYTYLLADTKTKEAVLIDPVIELAERDANSLNDLGLNLKYCSKTPSIRKSLNSKMFFQQLTRICMLIT